MKVKDTIGRYLPTWIATLSLAASLFWNFKQSEKIDELEGENQTLTEQCNQANKTVKNLTTSTEAYEGAIKRILALDTINLSLDHMKSLQDEIDQAFPTPITEMLSIDDSEYFYHEWEEGAIKVTPKPWATVIEENWVQYLIYNGKKYVMTISNDKVKIFGKKGSRSLWVNGEVITLNSGTYKHNGVIWKSSEDGTYEYKYDVDKNGNGEAYFFDNADEYDYNNVSSWPTKMRYFRNWKPFTWEIADSTDEENALDRQITKVNCVDGYSNGDGFMQRCEEPFEFDRQTRKYEWKFANWSMVWDWKYTYTPHDDLHDKENIQEGFFVWWQPFGIDTENQDKE